MIDPLILVRFVHFTASLLAGGTICLAALVAEPVLRGGGARAAAFRRRCDVMVWAALAAAIPTGAAWLVLVASGILGAPLLDVCLHGGAWSVALETRFGNVMLARLAFALLLAAMLFAPGIRWLQLAVAAFFIAPVAFAGHSGAVPGVAGDLYLAADVAHVLAAASWVGALPALALLLMTARRAATPAWRKIATQATRRFSILGIVCVGALLASGLVNSWNLVGSFAGLTGTAYGRVLMIKVALFAVMVGFAAINRFILTPRLPAATALRSLARNSLAEVTLGAGVLLAVGALGVMEPGRHMAHESADIPADATFVHIHMPEVMVDVMIEPGRAGPATATLRIMREDGSEYPAKDVKLALDPPSAPPTAARDAQYTADGTWRVGGINLAQPGNWTARVLVGMPGKPPAVLDGPIVIEPR